MRKFVIWVLKDTEKLELPDTESDESCEAACREVLEAMLGNIDSGFNEVMPDGSER